MLNFVYLYHVLMKDTEKYVLNDLKGILDRSWVDARL